MSKTKRNRATTMQRIVDALEQLLTQGGIQGVSIKRIAQTAQVNQVLIYRYFGGLPGLFAHYLRMGRLVPHYSTDVIEQIRPLQPADLAPLWSGQALQLFRRFRASPAARHILKATLRPNDPLADVVSGAQDEQLTRLVDQLAFVEGSDHQASSAVVLGALSYLTIQAHHNRPMIGIDLRSEAGWQRIEGAVQLICQAMGRVAIDSPTTRIATKPVSVAITTW